MTPLRRGVQHSIVWMCHHLWTQSLTNAHLDSSFLSLVLKNGTAANNLINVLYVFSALLDHSTLPPMKVINWSSLHARQCMDARKHLSSSLSPTLSHTSMLTLYTKLWTETKPPVEEWYQSPKSWSPAKSLCDQLPVRGHMRRIQPSLESHFPTVNISDFAHNSEVPRGITKCLRWHLTSSGPLSLFYRV